MPSIYYRNEGSKTPVNDAMVLGGGGQKVFFLCLTYVYIVRPWQYVPGSTFVSFERKKKKMTLMEKLEVG